MIPLFLPLLRLKDVLSLSSIQHHLALQLHVPMPTGLVLISSLQLFLQNFFLSAILTYVTSYVTLLRRLRCCCCCRRCRKHRRKIILDTDIGDDIDDALAVLLTVILHAIGVVEVVAIITSGKGNHQLRSKLVHTLACAVLGNGDGDGTCSLPIIAGRTKGTSKGHYMTHGSNFNMHTKKIFPVLDEKNKAWLLRTIANEYDSGHQITYLCIGLLDNLKYIQPPPSSISLCLMGGCFGVFFDGHQAPAAFPEYNVAHSIDSWQWAVRTFSNILLVPLDVAGVCRFREWPLRLQSCPAAYRQMYETWYHSPQLQGSRILEGTKNGTLSSIQFDACALYLCLYPEAANVKIMHVEFTSTGETRESTCIDNQGHIVRVALSWKDQSGFNKWVLWLLTIVTQREAAANTATRISTLFVIFVIFIKV